MLKKIQSSAIPLAMAVVFVIIGAAAIRTAAQSGVKSSGPSKIPFTTDSKEAFAKAKDEGKIVMVDFNADWCGPCQQMKREFFSDERAANLLKGVVAIDLNVDNPGKASDLLDKYSVEGLPTLLFLDADGNEIGRTLGYRDFDQKLGEVKSILARS